MLGSVFFYSIIIKDEVKKMNAQEKMLKLIEKKKGGGKSNQTDTPKNDLKNMRKGPKIFNK